MPLAEGQHIGPYQIVAQVGQGGMATIYKAYHPRLDRYVAIKVMHQAFLQDPGFLSRFEREARIVAKLEHPNIVPVYDFADVEGQPYLVMKHIDGQSLRQINERGGLTLADIVRILPPVASALDYAHAAGVLHRDIKPSNIILDGNGVPYLTDFGLARLAQMGESTLSADVLLGTPHYISPEQAMGRKDVDWRTDLYSFGVVIYELFTGRVPFSADTPYAVIHDHIYTPLPSARSLNPELTTEIEAVLTKALAKDPHDRYETAGDMVQALLTAVRESGLTMLRPDRREAAMSRQDVEAAAVAPPVPASFDPFSGAAAQEQQDGATVIVDTPTPQPPAAGKRALDITFDDGRLKANLNWGTTRKSWEIDGKTIEKWGQNAAAAHAASKDTKQPEPPPEIDSKSWHSTLDDIGVSIRDVADELTGKDTLYLDDEASARKRIQEQINKKREFRMHAITYVFVNILLLTIFVGVNTFLGSGPWSMPWPLIVALGWGAGLFSHGVETYFQTGTRAAKQTRAVMTAYYNEFGPDWRSQDRRSLRRVRRVAEKPFIKRREFFSHLAVYSLIVPMLWIIWLSVVRFLGDGPWEFPWPLLVMFGWGIGVVSQGYELFTTNRDESVLEREMEREREILYGDISRKRKNEDLSLDDFATRDPDIRLNEDGELTDSTIRGLTDDERRARRF